MIKNVVCDLGGVVIDLERQRCIDAFKALGYNQIEADLGLYVQRGPFFDLECGRITAGAFFDHMRPLCPGAKSDADIQEAFNAFLVALPVERLRAIRALRGSKRVFALSNTNTLMFDSWIAEAFRQEGLGCDDYFEGVVASFREQCCKPNPEIFRILLRRYGLEGAHTLMLDDSAANCEAARAAGLQAWQITPELSLLQAIEKLTQQTA